MSGLFLPDLSRIQESFLRQYNFCGAKYAVQLLLQWMQMHIVDKRLILFAENIEECLCLRSAAIKCTLNRHSIFVIVVLVIREYHQLRDIQEWAKCLVASVY